MTFNLSTSSYFIQEFKPSDFILILKYEIVFIFMFFNTNR